VARDAESSLREAVERLGLGVDIVGISVREVRPPEEVSGEFREVQAAESHRDQRRFEAIRRASEIAAAAKAKARDLTARAEAQAGRTVQRARGEADRFLALLPRTEDEAVLGRQQLFADAMARLLPALRRKVVVGAEGVDLTVIGND
jgi:membrane protease subunit HflK